MKGISIYIIFCFALISNQPVRAQSKGVDSLKLGLKQAKHDTTRIGIYVALGEEFYATQPDTALAYWSAANELSEKNSLKYKTGSAEYRSIKKNQADALGGIGYIFKIRGDIFRALDYYHQALKICEEMRLANGEPENAPGTAAILNNLGSAYNNLGDISKALEFYSRTLKLYEEMRMPDGEVGNKTGIANTFHNMGYVYKDQNDLSKALEYFNLSLKMRETTGDKSGIAYSLNSIGNIYDLQKNVSGALECYNKSLKIREELNDKKSISVSLNNIALVYYNNGDPSVTTSAEASYQAGLFKAIEYLKRSIDLDEEKYARCTSYSNMANAYSKVGRFADALIFAGKAMDLARELGYPQSIKSAAASLRAIYKKQNKFQKALEMYELEISMRDSINNEKNRKASIKTQLKYEYEKKSAADSVKNAEQQKVKDAQLTAQNASLKQEKFQRYSLVVGLLVVLVGLGFVINRFLVTQKQKKIIEEQKIKVDEAFEKLHEKNKEVLDSIHYARRIQRALITSEYYIAKNLGKLNKGT